MKGLLKKEFLLIKGNLKFIVLLFVICIVMAINGISATFIFPFMSIAIMMSTFSYDSYNKWDAYVATLPDGRENSVRAKYLATAMLATLMTAGAVAVTLVVSIMQQETVNVTELGQTSLILLSATVVIQMLMYPFVYKFGIEKARIGIFVGVFGLGFILSLLAKILNVETVLENLEIGDNAWMIVVVVMAMIVAGVSYKISERIYQKKEF